MAAFLSVLAIVAGALASLTGFVFLMAGAPNSTTDQLNAIYGAACTIVVFGIASPLAGALCLKAGRYRLAAIIGLAPIAISTLLVVFLAIIFS